MKKNYGLVVLFLCSVTIASSQSDSALKEKYLSIFDKISKGVKEYKLDTSFAPNDKITKKIIELRNLRGGFNINEVVDYKIEEDKQKGEISGSEASRFSEFMNTGNGKKWLDNSVIWIYRQHFTFKELKQLVKFYRTAAGRKMSEELPIVIMQSLIAADMIKSIYSKQQQKK